jgi:ribosomal protein L16/L10AE
VRAGCKTKVGKVTHTSIPSKVEGSKLGGTRAQRGRGSFVRTVVAVDDTKVIALEYITTRVTRIDASRDLEVNIRATGGGPNWTSRIRVYEIRSDLTIDMVRYA